MRPDVLVKFVGQLGSDLLLPELADGLLPFEEKAHPLGLALAKLPGLYYRTRATKLVGEPVTRQLLANGLDWHVLCGLGKLGTAEMRD